MMFDMICRRSLSGRGRSHGYSGDAHRGVSGVKGLRMRLAGWCVAAAAMFVLCVTASAAGAQAAGGQAQSADQAFQAGRFAEAGALAMADAKRDPADAGAALLLGRIALLANRLKEARE